MDKKIGLWITLLLLMTGMFIGGIKDVSAADGSCTYTLASADKSQTSNTTFAVVITSASNQTDDTNTFVRLENQAGFTYFTNQTASVANSTGETATYSVRYAPALDKGTYRLSSAFFYLNNSYYNYTALQFNCC